MSWRSDFNWWLARTKTHSLIQPNTEGSETKGERGRGPRKRICLCMSGRGPGGGGGVVAEGGGGEGVKTHQSE